MSNNIFAALRRLADDNQVLWALSADARTHRLVLSFAPGDWEQAVMMLRNA
jgi:hypothetical protein